MDKMTEIYTFLLYGAANEKTFFKALKLEMVFWGFFSDMEQIYKISFELSAMSFEPLNPNDELNYDYSLSSIPPNFV